MDSKQEGKGMREKSESPQTLAIINIAKPMLCHSPQCYPGFDTKLKLYFFVWSGVNGQFLFSRLSLSCGHNISNHYHQTLTEITFLSQCTNTQTQKWNAQGNKV